jgi:predicted  nucleic acid-binding Zn-ribbon protein
LEAAEVSKVGRDRTPVRLRAAGQQKETDIQADPAVQLRLLDLQGIDTTLAQLDHRRRSLPAHLELARLSSERAQIASDLVAADTGVSDLEADQAKAESDLEPVRARLARNEQRIADGSIADPKALSSLVEEVVHVRRRIGDLEDAELEVMEALETAQAERAQLSDGAAQLDTRIAEVAAERARELAELDAKLATARAERQAVTADLPEDLLTLYGKIGAGRGGVAAAELRQRRCTGCQLEVNAADLRRFAAAPPEEVLRCEECGRILVRTRASGL